MSTTKGEAMSLTGSSVAHTAFADNVAVQSVLSTETQSKVNVENTQKLTTLMSKLGTTHQQIDEYSRRRTEQISEEVAAGINRVVADTRNQQAVLIADANARSQAIEEEYKIKIQKLVEELDVVRAQNLATLEKDLNLRQEMILETAKKRIDDLNEEGNRLKLGALCEAQAQANSKVESITEQVAKLSAEDAHRLLSSTSTTIITTEARAAGESHVAGGVTVSCSKASMAEKSSASKSSSSTTVQH